MEKSCNRVQSSRFYHLVASRKYRVPMPVMPSARSSREERLLEVIDAKKSTCGLARLHASAFGRIMPAAAQGRAINIHHPSCEFQAPNHARQCGGAHVE